MKNIKKIKNIGCGCVIFFVFAVAGLIWLGNYSHQPSSSSNSAPPPTKWEIDAANRQRQSNIRKQKRDAELEEQKKAKLEEQKKAEIEMKKQKDAAVHSEQPTDTSLDFQKIEAWVFCQYAVEAKLISPSSATFPFGGAQRHVEYWDNGIFIIRSYVDSANGFGAIIRTNFFCKVQRTGNNKFNLIQLTFESQN